jgi:hypothetical protein
MQRQTTSKKELLHHILLQDEMGHETVYSWLENLKERDHLGDPDVDGRIVR